MDNVENIITDNLPIWSSAIQSKFTAGRGTSSKRNLYGVKKLRELILDLAVRGLLVPQDPSDEPASVLLENIAAERDRLVKEGKIKKQKLVTPLQGSEFLSHCPEGWVITSISEIAQVQPKNELSDHKDVGFVEMSSISSDHNGSHKQEVRRWLKVKKGYTHIKDGDIGLAKVTPCFENSKAAIFKGLENGFGAATTELHTARFFGDEIVQDFVLYHLKSAKFLSLGKSRMTGTSGLKRVPKDYFSSYPITLAPAHEQHRIVAKVDELMALCDTLEQQQEDSIQAHETLVEVLLEAMSNAVDGDAFQAAWERISEHFDALFTTDHSINKLKETILQLAVMGKLVPQDPSDEPASVLLEKIAAEKERLVKEGKIKKQKPLLKVSDEEKLDLISENWQTSRLGNLGVTSTGKTPSTSNSEFFVGNIPFVGPGQITPTGNWIKSDKSLSDKGLQQSSEANPNDILMVCIGGSIGKSAIALEKIAFNQQINAIKPLFIEPRYLKFAITTKRFHTAIIDNSSGSATPIINRSKWEALVVPIPPLAEQHRIVAKVDELMALCDQLKNSLQQAQETQILLTDAVVENAL
ncbi:restriction endonuclease subunit S [Planktomarina temperata]|nr:restriction endonuclease subunit S [Planktomarina temperata]